MRLARQPGQRGRPRPHPRRRLTCQTGPVAANSAPVRLLTRTQVRSLVRMARAHRGHRAGADRRRRRRVRGRGGQPAARAGGGAAPEVGGAGRAAGAHGEGESAPGSGRGGGPDRGLRPGGRHGPGRARFGGPHRDADRRDRRRGGPPARRAGPAHPGRARGRPVARQALAALSQVTDIGAVHIWSRDSSRAAQFSPTKTRPVTACELPGAGRGRGRDRADRHALPAAAADRRGLAAASWCWPWARTRGASGSWARAC